jgi:hypothetical protein
VGAAEYEKERRAYIRQAGAGGGHVLTLPGEDVFVSMGVEGFKSRSIAMLASMYDAISGKRCSNLKKCPGGLSDRPVFREQLDSPSDRSVVEFWFPAPPTTVTRYFVRVEIYHRGDGVLLAVADSKALVAN